MNRTIFLSLAVIVLSSLVVAAAYFYRTSPGGGEAKEYTLLPLPYAFNALEPYIDEETMRIHYTKHHAAYLRKLNATLMQNPKIAGHSLDYLLTHLDELPPQVRKSIKNNGGGYLNHTFFWLVMTPETSKRQLTGAIKEAIEKQFGSFDAFKKEFNTAAQGVFGSGWAWLVSDEKGTLSILATANQDSPITLGLNPILGLDVWEHAYYLKYHNRRDEYNDAWWQVVNWHQVEKNYQHVLARAGRHGNT